MQNQDTVDCDLSLIEIDEQHGQLFNLLEELDRAVINGDRWHVVHNVLVRISQWAAVHFAVEECLMRLFHHPQLKAHTADHADLVDRLRSLMIASLKQDVSKEASRYLREWKRRHIEEFDGSLLEHLRDIGRQLDLRAPERAAAAA
ncbi:MAG: hemerythrin domain-containing protein [Rhodocyclaceae bacterium]|jgi:hemerythrin|nr:hemerythrin domain-containing protein [Rhodocyclaceae bacterium]